MKRFSWKVAGYDRADAVRLCRGGLNPLVAVLLASRGVVTGDEIALLTSCGLRDITPARLLRDMDAAAARVRRAIERKEHVAVYGDYDVDGITASCLVADYLRRRGVTCEVYIPERLEEGYGVKDAALDAIAARGVTLVITVDCGITAAASQRHAAALGMDMVITDHHEVSGEVPASPCVDPKRPDCPSPAKMLAGVGVAFKLLCAVEGEEHTEELLDRYGDLVAVGTIADVMPVTGENRILIQWGLELVRRGTRPGLRELADAAGVQRAKLSVTGVGYSIAPRINAAGRLGGTDAAVRLLLTEDPAEAVRLAAGLCDLNRERQRIEGQMLSEALEMLKREPVSGPVVLASATWHQGVAGIVASRIVDRLGVPAVMICVKDGVGRGSCRSAGSFNLFEALDRHRDLLLSFGGHEMAAGITIAEENIPALREALAAEYGGAEAAREEPSLAVDFEVVKPELLTVENIDALDLLEPYGVGNPTPVLCMRGVTVTSAVPLSEGKHTKLWVTKGSQSFEAVFFGRSPEALGVREGGRADLAFTPQVNEFRGKRTAQLNLCDYIPLD